MRILVYISIIVHVPRATQIQIQVVENCQKQNTGKRDEKVHKTRTVPGGNFLLNSQFFPGYIAQIHLSCLPL